MSEPYIDIDKLSEEELLDLNHRIVERLKFLDSLHVHQAMMNFSIGSKVQFEPPGKDLVVGTIAKFNKKTVVVISDSGTKWKVSPHLLSQVENKSAEKANKNNTNVLEWPRKQ